MASEPRVYAHSSALVKLVLAEPESQSLGSYVEDRRVAASELALVEVVRAERLTDPPFDRMQPAISLFDRIDLVAVTSELLRRAADLTTTRVRSLDAIHLATALAVEPDEFVAYDERLLAAAEAAGLRVTSPR